MTNFIKEILDFPKEIAKTMIRFYQKFLSPDQSFWGKHTGIKVCIYHPSCSEYTYQAIDKQGVIKGSVMGFFRILRCNPFNKPGDDKVPEKFSIKRNS